MLWKPAAPVYPKLIQEVPEGLTREEATEMREKGENLLPICKLGKIVGKCLKLPFVLEFGNIKEAKRKKKNKKRRLKIVTVISSNFQGFFYLLG